MPKYTREQLIFFLKKKASELKKSPKIKEMNKPSYSSYSSRFGTWNNALRAAGLKINRKKEYTREELCENLRILAKEIGASPRPKDLSGRKWAASYSTYRKIFGSWANALKEAGLKEQVSSLRRFVGR